MERDEAQAERDNAVKDFNSHAHVERDLSYVVATTAAINFNSHAHVERDIGVAVRKHRQAEFQLTRSRGA